jgi:hypothetical protein
MPPDGGIVRPHDAPVEPFFSKDKFDASLSVLIFGEPLSSNSFPRSHTDLNSSHPGLGEGRFEGILIIKVLSASLSPEAINNEATQYV